MVQQSRLAGDREGLDGSWRTNVQISGSGFGGAGHREGAAALGSYTGLRICQLAGLRA